MKGFRLVETTHARVEFRCKTFSDNGNIAGVITVIHANFLRFNVNMCFIMLFSRTAFESIKCYFPVVQQFIIVSRHFSGIFKKRVFLAHGKKIHKYNQEIIFR